MFRKLFYLLILTLICSCQSQLANGDNNLIHGSLDCKPTAAGTKSYRLRGRSYHVLKNAKGFKQVGVASWYGSQFHRGRTASGERYNMYALTAAHKTLPLPTYVQVRNLDNGRSTVVKITDRGPFSGNRIIDLSFAAAKQIGMLHRGTAHVEVTALTGNHNTDSPSMPTAPVLADGIAPNNVKIFLQAGTFAEQHRAQKFKNQLRHMIGYPVFIAQDAAVSQKRFRVEIGPMKSVAESNRITQRLKRGGISEPIVRMDA